MRTSVVLTIVCTLAMPFILAQENAPTQTATVLREFTRSSKLDGIVLNYVLLNNRTVDVLFQAPGKYAMRANANLSTMFYVRGSSEKDIKLDTKYVLEQDGQTTEGTPVSIKNFENGSLAKGSRIDGILKFDKKIDFTHPFTLKSGVSSIEFKLSSDALSLLQQQQN